MCLHTLEYGEQAKRVMAEAIRSVVNINLKMEGGGGGIRGGGHRRPGAVQTEVVIIS